MPKLIGNTVVLHPETGEPVLLAADGPLPDWATDLVGAHLLDGPKGTTAPVPADERARLLARLAELDAVEAGGAGDGPRADGADDEGQDEPPPKGGAGSGAPAWRAYAARKGVTVPADASREDVVAALDEAGIPTE